MVFLSVSTSIIQPGCLTGRPEDHILLLSLFFPVHTVYDGDDVFPASKVTVTVIIQGFLGLLKPRGVERG